jgi:1-acyl-sn-glycerol-3-phosphate acyltransferase
MQRVLDWVFTIPFLLAFGLILAVFDPLQRAARLFGQRPQEVVAGALQRSLLWAFRICGTHIEVERSPAIRPWTPYLIVANHQSMFDIPIFGGLLFSNFPKYISKRSLARWIPSISYNLRRGGNAIIDRDDRGQALQAIRALGDQVRERGVSAVIYPEGTRARHGALGDFKPKGFLELLDAAPGVAVMPVAIDNSWQLLRHNLLPVPFGTRVRVHFGRPIARRPDQDGGALLAQARAEIEGVLARWRAAADPSAA